MNTLRIFNNEEFGKIRTVTINDEPYFVGKDVAEALGYERATKAILDHVDVDDKDEVPIRDSIGRMQKTPVINESGLYTLIFGSKLESAKRFKHWVTSEVLPALRKTGTYEMEHYSPEMKAILMHDKKLVKMESRIDKLENDIPLYGCEADEISGHVKRRGVTLLGGKQSEAYKSKDVRSKVYRDIYDQLKREFGLYDDDGHKRSYKALKRKNIYAAHEFIDCYSLPKYLEDLISNANAQLNMTI